MVLIDLEFVLVGFDDTSTHYDYSTRLTLRETDGSLCEIFGVGFPDPLSSHTSVVLSCFIVG